MEKVRETKGDNKPNGTNGTTNPQALKAAGAVLLGPATAPPVDVERYLREYHTPGTE